MYTALTRTQPSERSISTRLALADWLHRRLKRGGLRTDEDYSPKQLLQRYRMQMALLRTTLHRQRSELAADEAARVSTTASLFAPLLRLSGAKRDATHL